MLAASGALVLGVVVGCGSSPELNPQPLPPGAHDPDPRSPAPGQNEDEPNAGMSDSTSADGGDAGDADSGGDR